MHNNDKGAVWFDYMDNLRALALLVGIFFHAAMAYSPLSADLWPAANQEKSNFIAFVAVFTHTFRMPLFILISGFFAHMLLQKRGVKGFVKNRISRILIPLVVFFPLITIAIIGGMLWAIKSFEQLSPLLQLVSPAIIDPENNQSPFPFSTGHLWFLYNLLMFCGVLALMWKIGLMQSKWLSSLVTAKFILFILPLLLIPALSSVTAPFPAPDSVFPELWSFGFFGLFFTLGFALYGKQSLLDDLKRYAPFLCLISLVLYSYYFYKIKDVSMSYALIYDHQFLWPELPLAVLEAFISVYMTIWCLLIGKQYLSRKNKLLTIISRSSYWVYIIHLPVLLAIQYSMMGIDLGVGIEFLISSLATLVIGLGSYYLLVKPTPLSRLLNGKPNIK